MFDLESLLREKNKVEEFIAFYHEHANLPVALYGGGKGCIWFIKLLKKYQVPISTIVDSSHMGAEGSISGIPLASTEYLEKCPECIVIISALAYRKEIAEKVKELRGNHHIFVFDALLEVLQNVYPDERREFYRNSQADFQWLYHKLADDFSKQTLARIVEGAITSDCDCYAEISNHSQYFPELILDNMADQEIFVDAGAYTGDSITDFVAAVKNKYKLVYGFEPDKNNFAKCKKECSDERIRLYQYGVGKEKSTLFFSNESGGTQTDEGAHFVKGKDNGALEAIEVVSLDEVISDKVTYIKMDIEGMELDALKGAERLIRENRPKLAISVYHKMDDIIEIPKYIYKLDMGYHLYLRHYWSHNGTDTVLFAL